MILDHCDFWTEFTQVVGVTKSVQFSAYEFKFNHSSLLANEHSQHEKRYWW